MKLEEIKEILEISKSRFLIEEADLLIKDSNERSLTHKFAEKMQFILGCEWSVDCEYNRYGRDPKTIEEVRLLVGSEIGTDDVTARTVYPDIIVHKRGSAGPNLLVIEAKKDAAAKEKKRDLQKLDKIKKQYNYLFSAFVNFSTKEPDIEIFYISP